MQLSDSSVVSVTIPVPASIARLYANGLACVAIPVPPELFRQALGTPQADPRDRFSELDRLIADVVDDHAPVNAAEIARILEREHDHFTTDKGVRDRFGSKGALKAAGYRTTPNGYMPPDDASAA